MAQDIYLSEGRLVGPDGPVDVSALADSGTYTQVFGDPSGQPNGTPTALSDGTPATSFGNAPIVVAGGVYTHTPYAGPNSAGYLQVDVGERVDRIGCAFRFDPGTSGTIALVIPVTAWFLPGGLSATAFHLTLTSTGVWTLGRWDGSTVTAFRSGTVAAMNDGAAYALDCVRDDRDPTTFHLLLPDGSTETVTDALLASEAGTYAIWEIYEDDGTGVTPGVITQVWAAGAIEPWRTAAPIVQLAAETAAVNERWLTPGGFAATSGSPAFSVFELRWSAIHFDPATTEAASCPVVIPESWATMNVDLYWSHTGGTAGAGVRWTVNLDRAGEGESLGVTGGGGGASVTATAPTAGVLEVTSLVAGQAVDPTKLLNIRIVRAGADAADTLAVDAVVLGVMLRKAS